jgi:peptidoglycan hydrolase-like protein with peptidoglycan-binding domain
MIRQKLARIAPVRLLPVLVVLVAGLALTTFVQAPASMASPREASAIEASAASAAAKYPEGLCRKGAVHHTIQKGNSGKSVKHAQCLLNKYWGFKLKVDGIFGPHTEDAVEYVQDYVGVRSDGIVGRCTWPLLHLDFPPDDC